MLKVKRVADGVIFGFNGYKMPPANKEGFVVFDDAVPESEPETTNVSTVEDPIEEVFPIAKNPSGEPIKEPSTPEIGLSGEAKAPKAGPSNDSLDKYDAEVAVLRSIKTRGAIKAHIKEKYGEVIPKVNRKHSEVLKDAENIAYRNIKEK